MNPLRVRFANAQPLRPGGDFVLYWMVAARRRWDNFALQHAAAMARELDKPLLILEPLRVDYPHASARLHRFLIDGMAQNERDFASAPVTYYPYVEPERGRGRGLLAALGERAALVVSDDFPCFFLPRMQAAAAARLPVRLDLVDGNGVLPLRAADRALTRAFDFRRLLQRELGQHLRAPPAADPLHGLALRRLGALPQAISERWPQATCEELGEDSALVARLPLDQRVRVVTARRGGSRAGLRRAEQFVEQRLEAYADASRHPDLDGTSGLSPYLHFGHVSAHRVFALVAEREQWSADDVGPQRRGQKERFWQMRPGAEEFLDQLLVWRELGYNFCAHRSDYDRYSSLPAWALSTLSEHQRDARPALYSLEQLEQAETADEIWNAAQRELLEMGSIHTYLRMLWGKRVIEWTQSPEAALSRLIHLNDKYALDGRDPNAYSGIFWCFGRYDRPWPERPVFGTVRFMSSDSTRRKLKLKGYLQRFGPTVNQVSLWAGPSPPSRASHPR